MIAVIDYGMGNLRSVSKALEKVGGDVVVTGAAAVVERADSIVLPGVGAFEKAMKNFTSAGMDEVVRNAVAEGKPFLGICLGLQFLFETSLEDGQHQGLGIFPGKVVRFEADPSRSDMKNTADRVEPRRVPARRPPLRRDTVGDLLLLRPLVLRGPG